MSFKQRHYFSPRENRIKSLYTSEQYLECLDLDIDYIEGLLIFSDEALKIHLFDIDNYNSNITRRKDLENYLLNIKKLKHSILKELENGK